MRKIFIRIKPDDFISDAWMITVQAEGFSEAVGFLDDKLEGLHGSKMEMFKLAESLRKVEQDANPDAKVVVLR